jgi:hypothetical protein
MILKLISRRARASLAITSQQEIDKILKYMETQLRKLDDLANESPKIQL